VRSRDSAPDDSDSASVDLSLGLVDVGDSLDVSVVQVMWVSGWQFGLVLSGLCLPFLLCSSDVHPDPSADTVHALLVPSYSNSLRYPSPKSFAQIPPNRPNHHYHHPTN